MRRIVLAFMSTLAAVVLLFGYRTSTPHPVSVATTTVAADTPAASGSSSPAAAAPAARTVTGSVAETRWGPVQVQITVSGGKVTAADAVVVPSGNGRDQEINGYAVPVLDAQAVTAQSAQLDGVSGATVTSDGYRQSLQSALDAAGL